MTTSESGSDSEPEFESIIATRARRSNAGSRLRQLLDLEETNNATLPINDEDENVNLLFMEDENDREFEGSEDEDTDEEREGSDGDNHEDQNGNNNNIIISKTKQNKLQKPEEKGNETRDENDDDSNISAVNSDEMLSDSEISASDEDESEGERQLQTEERLRKRRKRKSDMPPILQKKKIKSSITPKKSVTSASSNKANKSKLEPIAPTLRRHSTRRTTIESSIATHERLEKEYERKQTQAPVERKVYIEKTLEERLEEAKITEKENILSLTRFYEQEVQKKKKQRDLSNSKKFKMTNFIRFSSKGTFITPNDEVRIIEKELQKLKEEEEQKNKRKLQYLKRKQARITKTEPAETIDKGSNNDVEAMKNENSNDLNKGNDVDLKLEGDDKKNDLDKEEPTKTELKNDNNKVVRFEENEIKSANTVELSNKPKDESDISKNDNENVNSITNDNESKQSNIETTQIGVDEYDGVDAIPTIVYEGPPQLVTRDYIIFEEFDKTLSNDEIKKQLFGPQSTLSGSHYDPLYETLCVIKQDESSNIDLKKIQEARDESFKSLMKLPKFGEKITFSNDDDGKSSKEENEIVNIHTPAPIGIHLPNGQKKMCIVSGLPATYYDPTNGVPYSTVDAFKILKGIVDGEYQWLQLDNGGINSRFAGGIGCYLSKKNQRHAAGVPEGFS